VGNVIFNGEVAVKRVAILQHAPFEGPARIADLLREAGCELDVRALDRGHSVPTDLERGDLLVVMGGPMGVGDLDHREYPYLRAEVELLRQRVLEDAPVLGVCLGAQLLAYAAGAAVYPMTSAGGQRAYEVGWAPVNFHTSSGAAVLAGIPAETTVLHWHGDTFDLPAGAKLLASSARCPNQGFQLGNRVFGLQFHCEVAEEDVENFLHADAAFVTKANGKGAVEALRRDTATQLDLFRDVGDRLLGNIIGVMIAS
jgi:GMP synthase (glutamine-hydrolysing)